MRSLIVIPGCSTKGFFSTPILIKPIYKFFPIRYSPLRAVTLASYISEKGYECNILDLSSAVPFRQEKIIKKCLDSYDYIIFTFNQFENYPEALKLSKICKEINPKIKIIFEGAPTTFLYKDVLTFGYVDYSIIGEGEKPLLELISGKKEKSKILGLAYNKNGKIFKTKIGEPIDMNLLPSLQWEKLKPIHFKYGRYFIETSRGCPMKCTFCYWCRWENKLRFMDSIKVCRELEKLENSKVALADLNFTTSKIHVKKICEKIIMKNLSFLELSARSHVDFLNTEILKIMKKAGFTDISIGVESLSPNVLKRIKKTKNPIEYIKKCIKIIKFAKNLGFNVFATCMTPIPGQTMDETSKELKLLKKYADVYLNIFTPFPGTPEWNKMKDRLITKNMFYYDGLNVVFKNNILSNKQIKKLNKISFPFRWRLKNFLENYKQINL
jgi:radical SAM superfamily enzyme YgiQ (UPF0313 family)